MAMRKRIQRSSLRPKVHDPRDRRLGDGAFDPVMAAHGLERARCRNINLASIALKPPASRAQPIVTLETWIMSMTDSDAF